MSAGGVDISIIKNDSNIKAILWAGYPGEEGGRATADDVFGKHIPGGRLPLTWYEANYVHMLPMTSMQLRPEDSLGFPGRTYKFYNGSTVYPFGYGLSYIKFNYKMVPSKNSLNVKLSKLQHCRDMKYNDGAYKPPCPSALIDDLKCDYEFEFEIEVHTSGSRDGSEVVMVYAMPPKDISRAPIKQLSVPAGRKPLIKFVLNVCKSLSIVDYNAYQLLPAGEYTIVIGDGALTFPVEVSFES